MKRRLLNLLAVVSLLLCAGVVWLWVKSYSTAETIEYTTARGTYCEVESFGPGLIQVLLAHGAPPPTGLAVFPAVSHAQVYGFFPTRFFLMGGIMSAHGTIANWFNPNATLISSASAPYRSVAVSDLHAVVVLLFLSVFFVGAGWVARPKRVGLCPSCGYDLRASPERCPECGAGANV